MPQARVQASTPKPVVLTEAIELGAARVAWGTTVEGVRATAGLELMPANPYASSVEQARSVVVSVEEVAGLSAVACELLGPAPHKPVLEASYGLASGRTPMGLGAWLPTLIAQYGEPDRCGDEPTGKLGQSGTIIASAVWQRHAFALTLSAYGAPRVSAQTGWIPTSGFLSVAWRDWEAAARPYLEAISAFEEQLRDQGPRSAWDARTALGENQTALSHGVRARRAVEHDHVYDTPSWLAEALGPDGAALWRLSNGSAWLLSTCFDTLEVAREGPLRLDVRPSGLEDTLTVDGLALRSVQEKKALRAFATNVAKLVGRPLETFDAMQWR